ncbi:hypothetical protein B481_2529 [Planococcus halocryophilus Or1]|nr:hypothetical protein B481_2529 [Planococcus halocryophilus Or1]
MNLKDSYTSCEKVIAMHSKSFYKAFSLLPKEKEKQFGLYMLSVEQ